jgi:hypothetical protein
MPKGGRKGGSIFPRVTLTDAVAYAKKLVSKTHTAPQSQEVILMGVIGSKHDKGKYGMSALKQFGLMKGDAKSGYVADELAKRITAAPPEELVSLYRQAALKPTVFNGLFATYHGDTVSKAKLKQRASDLKVHPDECANCVELYVSSLVAAGLVTVAGDQVSHLASSDASSSQASAEGDPADLDGVGSEEVDEGAPEEGSSNIGTEAGSPGDTGSVAKDASRSQPKRESGHGPRAVFNVNVTLDSSLDTEKRKRRLKALLTQVS